MCTVTVLKNHNGLLLTMNRDESRLRDEAGLHLIPNINNASPCYPKASSDGGTWIGCNRSGLIMCLLNRYGDASQTDATSRGEIIPFILQHHSFCNADTALFELNHSIYNPFDILLMNKNSAKRYTWNGRIFSDQTINIENGYMISSSSVNMSKTLRYRHSLFELWKAQHCDVHTTDLAPLILRNFHLRQEPTDLSSSVLMARQKTHTKSITQIETSGNHITLRYCPKESLDDLIESGTFKQEHKIN